MATGLSLQLSFFARDQSDGDLNRFSGAAGGSSTHDLQFQSSLRVQRRDAGVPGKLAFAIWDRWTALERLERMRSSNAVRGLGGHGDQRYALQCPNDAIDLNGYSTVAAASILSAVIVSEESFPARAWRSERGAPFARQR